jgi:hypothetical protein
MKKIELTIGDVDILDSLTWGQQEEIRNVILSGVSITDMSNPGKGVALSGNTLTELKYKLLEMCIKKITLLKDGKEVKYSKDWMNSLSVEDGDALWNAVNELSNAAAKK